MAHSVANVRGASSAIGRTTALPLTHDFAGVVLAARVREGIEEVAGKAEASCVGALAVEVDLVAGSPVEGRHRPLR